MKEYKFNYNSDYYDHIPTGSDAHNWVTSEFERVFLPALTACSNVEYVKKYYYTTNDTPRTRYIFDVGLLDVYYYIEIHTGGTTTGSMSSGVNYTCKMFIYQGLCSNTESSDKIVESMLGYNNYSALRYGTTTVTENNVTVTKYYIYAYTTHIVMNITTDGNVLTSILYIGHSAGAFDNSGKIKAVFDESETGIKCCCFLGLGYQNDNNIVRFEDDVSINATIPNTYNIALDNEGQALFESVIGISGRNARILKRLKKIQNTILNDVEYSGTVISIEGKKYRRVYYNMWILDEE